MSILLRRILASIIDLLIIKLADGLIFYVLHISGGVPIFGVYSLLLGLYKTTPGGILLKLKTLSLKGQELSSARAFAKCFVIGVLIFAHSILTAALALNTISSLILLALFIFIELFPTFFTRKKLMLHDLVSCSQVVLDESDRFGKKDKATVWLICVILVFGSGVLTYANINKTRNCVSLYEKQSYQQLFSECRDFARRSMNPNLNLLIGDALLRLKNYDLAIECFSFADLLGYKPAAYLVVYSYMQKGELDKALRLSEKKVKDPNMMALTFYIHLLEFSKTNNLASFIKAAAYLKVASYYLAQNQKAVNNEVLQQYLAPEVIRNSQERISQLMPKILSEQQRAEVENRSRQIRQAN